VGISWIIASLACATTLPAADAPEQESAAKLAGQILKATGVSGGLIVHVGCGDGKLTAALRADDGCLVHGLDRDAESVRIAREHIQSLGVYGSVSVEQLRVER
jgi:2-polyprenyl-3-methyl-5-hydroxy-6-metoxy-1,4-benzoquinol methylase